MQIETKNIKDLKPAEYNPRSITEKEFAGLVASIKQFGLACPLVVNKQTGYTVVGGNQRYRALKELGYEEIEVVVLDMPLPEEKALNVVLNDRNKQGNYTKELEFLVQECRVDVPELFDIMELEKVLLQIPIPIIDEIEITGIDEPKEEPDNGDWIDVSIGDIKGKIPLEVYRIFTSEHDRIGTLRETNKLTPIFEAIIINSANTPLESIS